jgi:hypothetical protein
MHLAARRALNRYMNRIAQAAFQDVDLILFLVEAGRWSQQANVAQAIAAAGARRARGRRSIVADETKLLHFVSAKAGAGVPGRADGLGAVRRRHRGLEQAVLALPAVLPTVLREDSSPIAASASWLSWSGQLILRLPGLPYAHGADRGFKREAGCSASAPSSGSSAGRNRS